MTHPVWYTLSQKTPAKIENYVKFQADIFKSLIDARNRIDSGNQQIRIKLSNLKKFEMMDSI